MLLKLHAWGNLNQLKAFPGKLKHCPFRNIENLLSGLPGIITTKSYLLYLRYKFAKLSILYNMMWVSKVTPHKI